MLATCIKLLCCVLLPGSFFSLDRFPIFHRDNNSPVLLIHRITTDTAFIPLLPLHSFYCCFPFVLLLRYHPLSPIAPTTLLPLFSSHLLLLPLFFDFSLLRPLPTPLTPHSPSIVLIRGFSILLIDGSTVLLGTLWWGYGSTRSATKQRRSRGGGSGVDGADDLCGDIRIVVDIAVRVVDVVGVVERVERVDGVGVGINVDATWRGGDHGVGSVGGGGDGERKGKELVGSSESRRTRKMGITATTADTYTTSGTSTTTGIATDNHTTTDTSTGVTITHDTITDVNTGTNSTVYDSGGDVVDG